jgi:glycosyltransferase involved in cell wall biosynthesis
VWDQHELPPDRLLRSRAFKALYNWLTGRCDRIVMANGERRELIAEWAGGATARKTIEVLENLPDRQFAGMPVRPLPRDVSQWLQGAPYFLAQGGANPDRHLASLVEATLDADMPKLIVVGPYSQRQTADLEALHGPQVRTRVLFTGAVPQMELTHFIDHAVASVVLYPMNSENTRLCASNRLYQALSRGVPVVVGSNPPMAHLVKELQCGVVLQTDGAGTADVRAGLMALMARREEFRRAARLHGHRSWESQLATIGRLATACAGTYPQTVCDENRLPAAGTGR